MTIMTMSYTPHTTKMVVVVIVAMLLPLLLAGFAVVPVSSFVIPQQQQQRLSRGIQYSNSPRTTTPKINDPLIALVQSLPKRRQKWIPAPTQQSDQRLHVTTQLSMLIDPSSSTTFQISVDPFLTIAGIALTLNDIPLLVAPIPAIVAGLAGLQQRSQLQNAIASTETELQLIKQRLASSNLQINVSFGAAALSVVLAAGNLFGGGAQVSPSTTIAETSPVPIEQGTKQSTPTTTLPSSLSSSLISDENISELTKSLQEKILATPLPTKETTAASSTNAAPKDATTAPVIVDPIAPKTSSIETPVAPLLEKIVGKKSDPLPSTSSITDTKEEESSPLASSDADETPPKKATQPPGTSADAVPSLLGNFFKPLEAATTTTTATSEASAETATTKDSDDNKQNDNVAAIKAEDSVTQAESAKTPEVAVTPSLQNLFVKKSSSETTDTATKGTEPAASTKAEVAVDSAETPTTKLAKSSETTPTIEASSSEIIAASPEVVEPSTKTDTVIPISPLHNFMKKFESTDTATKDVPATETKADATSDSKSRKSDDSAAAVVADELTATETIVNPPPVATEAPKKEVVSPLNNFMKKLEPETPKVESVAPIEREVSASIPAPEKKASVESNVETSTSKPSDDGSPFQNLLRKLEGSTTDSKSLSSSTVVAVEPATKEQGVEPKVVTVPEIKAEKAVEAGKVETPVTTPETTEGTKSEASSINNLVKKLEAATGTEIKTTPAEEPKTEEVKVEEKATPKVSKSEAFPETKSSTKAADAPAAVVKEEEAVAKLPETVTKEDKPELETTKEEASVGTVAKEETVKEPLKKSKETAKEKAAAQKEGAAKKEEIMKEEEKVSKEEVIPAETAKVELPTMETPKEDLVKANGKKVVEPKLVVPPVDEVSIDSSKPDIKQESAKVADTGIVMLKSDAPAVEEATKSDTLEVESVPSKPENPFMSFFSKVESKPAKDSEVKLEEPKVIEEVKTEEQKPLEVKAESKQDNGKGKAESKKEVESSSTEVTKETKSEPLKQKESSKVEAEVVKPKPRFDIFAPKWESDDVPSIPDNVETKADVVAGKKSLKEEEPVDEDRYEEGPKVLKEIKLVKRALPEPVPVKTESTALAPPVSNDPDAGIDFSSIAVGAGVLAVGAGAAVGLIALTFNKNDDDTTGSVEKADKESVSRTAIDNASQRKDLSKSSVGPNTVPDPTRQQTDPTRAAAFAKSTQNSSFSGSQAPASAPAPVTSTPYGDSMSSAGYLNAGPPPKMKAPYKAPYKNPKAARSGVPGSYLDSMSRSESTSAPTQYGVNLGDRKGSAAGTDPATPVPKGWQSSGAKLSSAAFLQNMGQPVSTFVPSGGNRADSSEQYGAGRRPPTPEAASYQSESTDLDDSDEFATENLGNAIRSAASIFDDIGRAANQMKPPIQKSIVQDNNGERTVSYLGTFSNEVQPPVQEKPAVPKYTMGGAASYLSSFSSNTQAAEPPKEKPVAPRNVVGGTASYLDAFDNNNNSWQQDPPNEVPRNAMEGTASYLEAFARTTQPQDPPFDERPVVPDTSLGDVASYFSSLNGGPQSIQDEQGSLWSAAYASNNDYLSPPETIPEKPVVPRNTLGGTASYLDAFNNNDAWLPEQPREKPVVPRNTMGGAASYLDAVSTIVPPVETSKNTQTTRKAMGGTGSYLDAL